jgi:hypothetical protein
MTRLAFRVVVALAWGYDWLYDHLDEGGRTPDRFEQLLPAPHA